jgi:hypothetical protein
MNSDTKGKFEMILFRWLLVAGVAYWGYSQQGYAGIVWALMIFGIIAFVWYAATDGLHAIANFMQRPKEVHHYYHAEDGAIKGHPDVEGTARRHPDPTRPDMMDEFAGAITYRLHKGGKWS